MISSSLGRFSMQMYDTFLYHQIAVMPLVQHPVQVASPLSNFPSNFSKDDLPFQLISLVYSTQEASTYIISSQHFLRVIRICKSQIRIFAPTFPFLLYKVPRLGTCLTPISIRYSLNELGLSNLPSPFTSPWSITFMIHL